MKCPIDFTLLYDQVEGYAVHCSCKEEAEEFVAWTRKLFPDSCKNWQDGNTNYGYHGSNTIYTFNAMFGGQWKRSGLLYGSVTAAIGIGYKVLEYADICMDIEESEMSVESILRLQ